MPSYGFPEALVVHNQLRAAGWLLQRRPADAPRHAVGYYRHMTTGEYGYLVSFGARYVLQRVAYSAPANSASGMAPAVGLR